MQFKVNEWLLCKVCLTHVQAQAERHELSL